MTDRSVVVRLHAMVSGYQAAMGQATASTRALGTEVTRQSGSMTASMGRMAKTGSGLRRAIADPFTAMASPVGLATLALVGSAKAAIDFESAWAGVTKTVDGTPEQLDRIKVGIRDLAKEIPASTGEIAKVAEAAGQLGIETDSILEFSRVMVDLGNTTNLSAEEGASALARFANITQMSQGDFDKLGSTIVDLGNNFATTEAEIAEFGLRIAGAGKIAGLSESEILGIGTALSSVGVAAESGGTAVQKVLLGITEQVATGGDKLEQFARVAGMTAEDFATQWRQDPARAFTAFVEGLGTSGKGAIGILKDLGLTDQRLIRSFLSLANAGDLLNDSITTGNKAWEDNTALSEEAEKRYETTAAQLEVLWNHIQDLAIALGDVLLPVLNSLIGPLTDVVGLFSDLLQLDFSGVGEVLAKHFDVLINGTDKFEILRQLGDLDEGLITAAGAEDKLRYSAYLTATATEEQGDATKGLGGEAKNTADALEDLNDELDRLIGIHIDAERASLDFADSLADMRGAIDDSDGSLDRHTEEGRNARRAILDAADAAKDHAVAVAEETGSVDKGVQVLKNHVDRLKEDAEAAGISEDAIRDYIRELGLTPKQIRTLIELDGVDDARSQLRGLMGSLGAIDGWAAAATVTVTKVGPGVEGWPSKHSGGSAESSSARRVRGGLLSDEFPTILRRGELVLSAAQAQRGAGDSGGITSSTLARLIDALEQKGPATHTTIIKLGDRTLGRVVSDAQNDEVVLLGRDL